jgi:hypothetical protein
VRAARVLAGLAGAALADLAFPIYGGLPDGLGDLADRGLLASAQSPADRLCDLEAVPVDQAVELFDQRVAGVGAVAGDRDPVPQRGRQLRDRLAEQLQVIRGRVRPSGADAKHPGQWLARVIAGREQRMMPVAF